MTPTTVRSTPVDVEASVDRPVVVKNQSGDTIYYAQAAGGAVSTSDTSVAVGSSVTFTAPARIISAGNSNLLVTNLTRPTYDQASITTATVSAITGLADATFTNSTAALAHNKSIFYDGTTLVFRISASTITADLY